ncbi:potassium-transporting ATPase subunit beta-like [Triplophysa rosa]|uniref:Sodium/potassium-transporting ATPase subunit beta n=1 Tax=Triplophysa rosa TaxID=992332 RepID=A0A9W7X0C3_TRIRA|nr:potassium-transporting ATPase subunit beta-like [Triplophysa rosa]KAI7811428.1 putative potassium-transporting ATPase subunit beta [Triplophysa rosa]
MATLKEKRTCAQRCEDFGHFVWNSDNGTLFGRTLIKWVYISLYYVVFYIVMSALFSLAIYVLMYTLDPYAPDYQDRLSSPGVMVWPDTYDDEKVVIAYNTSNKMSWMKMVNSIRTLIHPYNDTLQEHHNPHNCTAERYFLQNSFNGPNHTKWACAFYQSTLGDCSGIDDPTFGYTTSQPCVIIKMNRIIGFLPNNGTGLAPRLNCTVLEGGENVSGYEYHPYNGTFDLSYFPYYGKLAQPNYVNPLVAVKFNLIKQKTAKIECRVVAKNIAYENYYDPFEGKVIFNLTTMS